MLSPGKRGLSGIISSSEVEMVFIASWYKGAELDMAYLDICDMISDRGFCSGGASGEDVQGILEFSEEGLLMTVEFELFGGRVGPEKHKHNMHNHKRLSTLETLKTLHYYLLD